MNLSKNWYIITNKSGQHRVQGLLQELNIGTPVNSLIYVRFGYKMMSAQDKETYYFIRDISMINHKKTNQPICYTGLDYLSISLGTNESTQQHRIKKLEKHLLLKTLKNGSYYVYDPPYPDSTFVSTIIKLIRRKRLGELIRLYHSCNNPILRIEYFSEINKLKSLGTSHSKIKTINSFEKKEEEKEEENSIGLIQTLAKMSKYTTF